VYKYDVAGAKKLLTEAGYSVGFSVEIGALLPDEMNIGKKVAQFWSAIGVNATVESIASGRGNLLQNNSFKSMMAVSFSLTDYGSSQDTSRSFLTYFDSYVANEFGDIQKAIDPAERARRLKALDEYCLWNVFSIDAGTVPAYSVAQPWVKGWGGDTMLRPADYGGICARLWVDTALKKRVTGKSD